jgi:hypothetical protein
MATRRRTLVGIAALFCTAALLLSSKHWYLPGNSPQIANGPGSIPSLLGERGSDRLKLFSSGLNPQSGERLVRTDRGFDILDHLTGLPKKRFLINGDLSTEDIDLKADGKSYARRETFFYALPGAPRQRHVTQVYSPTSDLVVDETVRRFEGTTAEHSTAAENGARTVTGYGKDGWTHIHELVVLPRANKYSQAVLKLEKRWREDAHHSLAYSNEYDPKDGTHTITEWDSEHRPLKVTHVPKYDTVYGTSIVAYQPGTSQVRFEAKVGNEYPNFDDVAKYFRPGRPERSLDYILHLSMSYLTVEYFDGTGQKLLLTQRWKITPQEPDGKKVYEISQVTLPDDQGNPRRDYYWWDGKLSMIEDYNRTIGGILYGEVDSVYDSATRTLKEVIYWVGKMDHKYDRDDVHTPKEGIAMPNVEKEIATMRINPELDELPIAPPVSTPF